MLETLALLGRTMGFSFAAGINLYATVAILGLAKRFGWVDLPEQFRVFDNDVVIAVALVLYVVEFVADKVPWVDSVWDAVHTVIRPIGGAVLAVATLGDASPTVKGLVALPRRCACDGHASDQGGNACGGQHQPGALLELGAEPRRRRVRHRPLGARAELPLGRGPGRDSRRGGDVRLRGVDCQSRQAPLGDAAAFSISSTRRLTSPIRRSRSSTGTPAVSTGFPNRISTSTG